MKDEALQWCLVIIGILVMSLVLGILWGVFTHFFSD